MGPRGAGSGRVRLSRAELGMHWGFNSITLGPWLQKDRPSGAAWGRVGPVRAGEGLGPGYKDRPSRAVWGRFGPSGAE